MIACQKDSTQPTVLIRSMQKLSRNLTLLGSTADGSINHISMPTLAGKGISGWATSATGEAVYPVEGEIAIPANATKNITLYAVWGVSVHKASFDWNYTDAPEPEQIDEMPGSNYVLPKTEPTRTGYTFAGWWTDSTGGTLVTEDTTVTTAADHTIYAHWTANEYTVRFENNDGTGAFIEQKETYDSKYVFPAQPSKIHYTFNGWWTDSVAGDQITSDTIFTTADNSQILYAHWKENSYILNFDANTAATVEKMPTSPVTQSVNPEFIIEDIAPLRTGYTFLGWATTATATVQEYLPGEKFTLDEPEFPAFESTATLYAIWQANTIDVVFDYNDGTGAGETISQVFDSNYILPDSDPIRTGYEFAGWFTSPTAGDQVSSKTQVTTAVEHSIYAHWDVNKYTVTFDANGHGIAPVIIPAQEYGSKIANPGTIDPVEGYTHNGKWYKEETCETEWIFDTDTMPDKDLVLYAKWNVNKHTVTFNENGHGTAPAVIPAQEYGTKIANPGIIDSVEGYTHNGKWYTEDSCVTEWNFTADTMPDKDLVLYAKWTANTHKVTFSANKHGEDKDPIEAQEYGTTFDNPGTITGVTGYTHDGKWYKEETCENEWIFDTDTMPDKDLVLYAKWSPNEYTVTFDLNYDGASPRTITMVETYDSTYVLPEEPTRAGYTFGGWFTEQGDTGTKVDETTIVKVTDNNTVLYAHWGGATYQVTFDQNYDGAPAPTQLPEVVDVNYVLPSPAPTRTGYTLLGWFTERTGGTQITTATIVDATAQGQTLYAQWDVNKHKVTFDANGHGEDKDPIDAQEYGTKIANPGTIDPVEGYTHDGKWYTEDTCETEWIFDTDTMPDKDLVLYAKWNVNKHTVTFNANGHGIAPAVIPAQEYGTKIANPGTIDPVEGYTHDGKWYTEDTCVTEWNFTADTMPDKDLVLYAKWTANTHKVTFSANNHGEDKDPIEAQEYGTTFDNPGTITGVTGYTHDGKWYKEETCETEWIFNTDTMPDKDLVLYAKWSVNTHKVTFNANGHGTAPAVIPAQEYGTKIASPEPFAPVEGYTNDGKWYTEDTCETEWDFTADTMPDKDLELFAKWSVNTHKVTFSANNHGEDKDPIEAQEYGTTFDNPGTITGVTGYTHDGKWYKEETCENEWIFDTDTMPDKDLVLFAKWSANIYTVTFDYNYGKEPTTKVTQEETYDNYYVLPAEPEREGYTFAGWFTDKGDTGTKVDETTIVKVTDDNTVLYAHWGGATYQVTFDQNYDGAPAPTQLPEVVDVNYVLPSPDPTRSGYTLLGWFTERTGGTQITTATIVDATAQGQILYAQWEVNDYTVTFDQNYTGAPTEDIEQTFDEKYILPDSEPTRTGYTFAGWWLDKSAETEATQVTSETIVKIADDHSVYAHWTANEYKVSFDANYEGADPIGPITQTYDAKYNLPVPDPTRDEHAFLGWFTEEEGGEQITTASTVKVTDDSQILYAQWLEKTYVLSFDANTTDTTVTDMPTTPVEQKANKNFTIEDITPLRTGYTFVGWAKTKTATDKEVGPGDSITLDDAVAPSYKTELTLYAVWSANKYTVTFNHNDGDTPTTEPMIETYDDKYILPDDPTRDEYKFLGWFTKEEGGEQITTASLVKVTDDSQVLYAQWEGYTYILNFDANTIDDVTDMPDTPVEQTANRVFTIENITPQRTGYTFKGWATTDSATIEEYAPGAEITLDKAEAPDYKREATLYAVWSANTYTVTFSHNYGDVPTTEPMIETYNNKYILPDDPTRTGYTFKGWFTESEEGIQITTDDDVKVTDDNQVLYAHWEANKYDVTFNLNYDKAPAPSVISETFDANYQLPSDPKRTGYGFLGWFTKDTGGDQVTTDTIVTTAENHTLYAQWRETTYILTFDENADGATVTDMPSPNPVEQTSNNVFTIQVITPLRYGYTFLGWAKTADATVKEYDPGSSVTLDEATAPTYEKELTLFAVWKARNYKVGYDPNISSTLPEGFSALQCLESSNGGYQYINTGIGVGKTLRWESDVQFTVGGNRAFGYADENDRGWRKYYFGFPNVDAANTLVVQADHNGLYGNSRLVVNDVAFERNKIVINSPSERESINNVSAETGYPWDDGGVIFLFAVNGGSSAIEHAPAKLYSSKMYNGGTLVRDFVPAMWNGGNVTYSIKGVITNEGPLAAGVRGLYDQANNVFYINSNLTVNPTTGAISGIDFVGQDPTTFTFDTNVTLAPNIFTNTHFSFAGWAVDPTTKYPAFDYNDEHGTMDDPADVSISGVGSIQSLIDWDEYGPTDVPLIKLYAVWQPDSYEVTFNHNDGEPSTIEIVTEAYGEKYEFPAVPTYLGHTFKGWFTAASGGTQITTDTIVKETAEGQTLYAQWQDNTYILKYNANAGEETVTDMPDSPVTKTADPMFTIQNIIPKRTGYTFTGWAESGTTTVKDYDPGETIQLVEPSDTSTPAYTTELTLYAIWEANTYKINYDKNTDDDVTDMPTENPATQTANPKFTIENITPKHTGYTFLGWAEDKTATAGEHLPGGVIELNEPIAPSTTREITLYAVWQENTYKLTFDKNAGTDTVTNMPAVNPVEQAHNPKFTIENVTPKRTGYSFLGWAKSASATEKEFVPGGEIILDDPTSAPYLSELTIYAVWQENTYTINYDKNTTDDVEDIPDTATQTADPNFIISSKIPKRQDYDFVGWATTDSATEKEYGPNDPITLDEPESPSTTSEITLYAIWEKSPVAVAVYDDGDHSLTFYYDNIEHGGDGKVVYAVPAKALDKESDQPWNAKISSIYSVNFDSSFVDYDQVTSITYWFSRCVNLESVNNLEYLNTTNLLSVDYAFSYCKKLTELILPSNVETFNLSKLINANNFLANAESLVKFKADESVSATALLYTSSMFSACKNLSYLDISGLRPAGIYKMRAMFSGCSSLSTIDISGFAFTESLNDMESIFYGCTSLETIYVGDEWNPSIEQLQGQGWENLFYNCTKLVGQNGTKCAITTYTTTGNVYAKVDLYNSPGFFTYGGANASGNIISVSYDANGGEWRTGTDVVAPYTQYGKAGTSLTVLGSTDKSNLNHITPPTKLGYSIEGWATSATGTVVYPAEGELAIPADASEDITLYAVWKANEYTVSYCLNYGESPVTETRQETYDSNYKLLDPEPTREGYDFKGWWTDPELETGDSKQITADTIVKITEPQVLYAHWEGVKVDVYFAYNYPDAPDPAIVTETYGQPFILPAEEPVKADKVFAGWWTTDEIDGTEITEETIFMETSSFTVYAWWTSKQDVLDLMRPVGSYYVQYETTDNPNDLFNKPTESLESSWDKVTMSQSYIQFDSTALPGSEVSESLPDHTHSLPSYVWRWGQDGGSDVYSDSTSAYEGDPGNNWVRTDGYLGRYTAGVRGDQKTYIDGGKIHPKGQTAVLWIRTA